MSIPVYMMPGLAASSTIFENINLDPEQYTIIPLKWKIPLHGETLTKYASRMLEDIKYENPVLLGVSFGGILVQEMAKLIPYKKLIIVSSVKSRSEMPPTMRISDMLKLYRIAPVRIFQTIDQWPKYAPSTKLKNKAKLYNKYLSVNDPYYLSWALKQMVSWGQEVPLEGLVHIHGNQDPVFPYKYIHGCITIDGGTHIMILTKFKWFNEHLPEIIGN